MGGHGEALSDGSFVRRTHGATAARVRRGFGWVVSVKLRTFGKRISWGRSLPLPMRSPEGEPAARPSPSTCPSLPPRLNPASAPRYQDS